MRQRFEYLIRASTSLLDMETVIENRSKEGWRLVAVIAEYGMDMPQTTLGTTVSRGNLHIECHRLFFERPVPAKRPRK